MSSDQLVDRVQRALADSAADITRASSDVGDLTVDERLEQLTRAAVDNVPGADYVVLTMRERGGGLASRAPTSPAVAELDKLQVALNEGPCVDAIAVGTSTLVEVTDFAAEGHRWPRFAPAAAGRGISSLLAYAMAPEGAVPGAVNFYSRTREGFDQAAKMIAGAFAMQAAIAVYGATRIADLERAVQTRDTIGQAKGILMERHRVDQEKAFAMLVRASQDTNMKLVDVARWLVDDIGHVTTAERPEPELG